MNNQLIIKSDSLFYCDAGSDKQYNVWLEEKGNLYCVNFAFGRRGNVGKPGTKTSTPVSLSEAEKIYDKLVAEKKAKGYQPDGTSAGFNLTNYSNMDRVTGLFPQLLNPITEDKLDYYINNPYFMLQEKLDGTRVMSSVKNGKVVASNRKGLTIGIPKEVEYELSVFGNICNNAVFDAELIGNTYYMFDLLEADGQDIRSHGALQRLLHLERKFDGNSHKFKHLEIVKYAYISPEAKQKLVNELKHKEGVVIKEINSTSKPGRPTTELGSQIKCKFWASCTTQVLKINQKQSIAVGVLQDGQIVGVGNVTVPASYPQPQVGDIVEVKYLYFYVGGSLYQPAYLGIRSDKDEADEYSTLKPKSSDTDSDDSMV